MKSGDLIDGRYLLEGMLGRGGMGVVWRALDRRLERRVALKLLHPANAPTDPAMHARFAREARLLATLDHPAVVSIYDYSADHDPPFLVMQLIDGHTLEQEVAHAPLERRRIRALLAPVADALAYAHGRGIVHRDLKPANVLLDREGRVRVTDFGLARLAFGETSITVGTQLIGSPEYWAPEQAAGRDTSTSADLYALGVILYLLASGELPFPTGEDRIQSGFRRIHEDAPSLGGAVPALQRLDPGLVALCDALLARDPAGRPTALQTGERLRHEPAAPARPRHVDLPTVVVAPSEAPTPATPLVPLPTPAERPAVPHAGYRPTALTPTPTEDRGSGGRRGVAIGLLGLTLALAGTAVAFTAFDDGDEPNSAASGTAAGNAATGAPAGASTSTTDVATTAGTTEPAATAETTTATATEPTATTEPETTPATTTATAPPATSETSAAPPATTAATPTETAEAAEAADRPAPTEGPDTPAADEGAPSAAVLEAALPATFRSSTCRFRHPAGWSTAARDVRRGASHVDNVVRGPSRGLEIVCDRDQRATTAAAIAQRVRGLYRGRRGYEDFVFERAQIAGRDAYVWEYTDGSSRFREAFFAPGVALRFAAPAASWTRYAPVADQVLASYDGP